ncbi:hypothetical protein BpHYR1_037048 [Brachionus plicatilis]|uniref:Uncharacterized protein n=1 Tax=Brachionus plicatilis TaxID=10195 RepID=A0A3M7SMB5_BRAPC|nr:hypothetical protein BpHYR1_037048 [Brachionus plicatilis]
MVFLYPAYLFFDNLPKKIKFGVSKDAICQRIKRIINKRLKLVKENFTVCQTMIFFFLFGFGFRKKPKKNRELRKFIKLNLLGKLRKKLLVNQQVSALVIKDRLTLLPFDGKKK